MSRPSLGRVIERLGLFFLSEGDMARLSNGEVCGEVFFRGGVSSLTL